MDIFCGKLISIDICHKKVLFFKFSFPLLEKKSE